MDIKTGLYELSPINEEERSRVEESPRERTTRRQLKWIEKLLTLFISNLFNRMFTLLELFFYIMLPVSVLVLSFQVD